ncbi:DUF3313 family protein [Niveispirillum fermenti]|uniref:DUF3313 family protein n=1 Tax=Niveispirillum fermenti TaxID=1233113 RepID=UPI003A8B4671
MIRAKTNRLLSGAVAGLLGLTLLTGTASAQNAWSSLPSQKAPPLPTEGLTEQDHSTLDKVFVRPGVNLASYGKVILAPIDAAVERRSDEVLLSVRDRDHAVEYMAERLKEELGAALVTEPGPGVLKMAITFTDYVPNRSFHAEKARGGGYIDRVYSVGRAAFQAVLSDSQSGQIVAVIADADMGLPFPDNVNTYTIYGDADRFTRRWAKQITKLVTSGANS